MLVFIICPIAIAYSYGTDNKIGLRLSVCVSVRVCSPVNNHRWPNAEYVPERLALADLHWTMRRTNRPVLTLALITDTRVLPSRPPPVIRTHVRLELATFSFVLASAAGSNKFMTATVAFQMNWPDKEKNISLFGLDLYSVSSFSS